MQPEPPFFLYDGACGFCQRWMRWLEQRVGDDVEFVAFQGIEDLTRYNLAIEDVQTASYWIDDEGHAFRGNRSIAQVLKRAPGVWRVIGTLLDLPVVRVLAVVVYLGVSRNRHRLPAPR